MNTNRRRRWTIVAIVLTPLLLLVGFLHAELWQWVAFGAPQPTAAGTLLFQRRADWITGTRAIHPEQPCPACVREDHDRCVRRTGRIAVWPPFAIDFFSLVERSDAPAELKLRAVSWKGERGPRGYEVRDITTILFEGEAIDVAAIRSEEGTPGVWVDAFDVAGLRITPDDFVCPCCE